MQMAATKKREVSSLEGFFVAALRLLCAVILDLLLFTGNPTDF